MSNERKPVVTSPGALAQMVRTLRLVWRLWNDARVPLFPKLIPLAGLLYIISPIDLIPDFVLGLGQVDDLGAALLSITLFIDMCPRAVVDEHRAALDAERGTAQKKEDVIEGSYRVVEDDEEKTPR